MGTPDTGKGKPGTRQTACPAVPGEDLFAREMNQLALRARGWFDADEHGLFALARDALPDRAALDRTLAERQEALLAAGPVR